MSMTLFHCIRRASIPSWLPQWIWLSIRADKRLCAAPIAWKSPVKWRLISSIGTTCAYPPPAAPPFIPKHGPKLGSLRQTTAFLPILFSPSLRPTEVVVFPSPAGVGVIAVTRINLPSFLFLIVFIKSLLILALFEPYWIKWFLGISSLSPISEIGLRFAFLAISISLIWKFLYAVFIFKAANHERKNHSL